MSLFKCHPIEQGLHQNVHFIAQDSNKMLIFYIIIFIETGFAYIVRHKTKLDHEFLDRDMIINELNIALNKWNYHLQTPKCQLFLNHDSTEAVLKHFNMYKAYVNVI